MNPRTTLVLLVVAALLGSFVYFYEIRGEADRKAAESEKLRVFPGLSASDVEWLELTSKDGKRVRLEHEDDVWRVTSPVEGAADDSNADAIANVVTSLETKGKVADAKSLDGFGLGKDAQEVQFSVGGKAFSLRIGGRTPVGGNTYVIGGPTGEVGEGAESRIAYVPTYRLNPLNKDLDELRDRRVLRFDRERVDSIDLAWKGGGVKLVESDDGWRVAEPVDDRADDSTVRDLLSDLSFLRADGFADPDDAAARASLDEPVFRATLSLAAGDAAEASTVEFVMGPDRDGKRVVRGTGTALFQVAAERLDDFKTDVVAYRYKQLALFDVSQARRVELRFPAAAAASQAEAGALHIVEAKHGDDGWSSTPEAMSPDAISSMVAELANLRGKGIAAEDAGKTELGSLGFAPPRVRIVVYGDKNSAKPDASLDPDSGEPILADVQLGRSDPALGLLARREGRTTIYRLDAALAQEVPTDWAAFESDFVMQAPSDATKDSAADDMSSAEEVSPADAATESP